MISRWGTGENCGKAWGSGGIGIPLPLYGREENSVTLTEIFVGVTEIPVSVTVTAKTLALQRTKTGHFWLQNTDFCIRINQRSAFTPQFLQCTLKTKRAVLAIFSTTGVGGGFRGHSRG